MIESLQNIRRHRRSHCAPLLIVVLSALLSLAVGCRQDMHNQPRYKPLRESDFFHDGRSARQPVPGTIARGQLRLDEPFFTGKAQGTFVATLPFPITRELLERGRERYDIYCSVCHDRAGYGRGMVVQRGFRQPPSFHTDRLRQAPVGYLFNIITNGFGQMPDYAAQIEPRDRWAIVAYIRALQLSQQATLDDVPAAIRQQLEKTKP
ncbi:MAG TPA: cytochrome c [Blastocatellia bacterium]|nr:cytochrome c [Blastocatellia bacterium]